MCVGFPVKMATWMVSTTMAMDKPTSSPASYGARNRQMVGRDRLRGRAARGALEDRGDSRGEAGHGSW